MRYYQTLDQRNILPALRLLKKTKIRQNHRRRPWYPGTAIYVDIQILIINHIIKILRRLYNIRRIYLFMCVIDREILGQHNTIMIKDFQSSFPVNLVSFKIFFSLQVENCWHSLILQYSYIKIILWEWSQKQSRPHKLCNLKRIKEVAILLLGIPIDNEHGLVTILALLPILAVVVHRI